MRKIVRFLLGNECIGSAAEPFFTFMFYLITFLCLIVVLEKIGIIR